MGERFTDSQMLRLVEIYREYQYLWDVNSAMYKNRDARDNAYKEISVKLNIPGVSAKDVPRKIKNLRSSYYQELKRIEKSTRGGRDPLYVPKVSWFTIADGFLRAFRNNKETFFNVPVIVKTEAISEDSMDDAILSGDNLSPSPGPSRQQSPPPTQRQPAQLCRPTQGHRRPSRLCQGAHSKNQTSQIARRRIWRREPVTQTSTLIEALNQKSELDRARNEIMQQMVGELRDLKEILKTRLPLPDLPQPSDSSS